MNKIIAIVAGEPNSINSEIIAKAWKVNKNKENLLVIGNFSLLQKQLERISIKIPLYKIKKIEEFIKSKKLCVLDIPLKFKSAFKVEIDKTKNYIFKSLSVAHNLCVGKKINGFINAPINKKIFNNKFLGVTEFLAFKNKIIGKEVMLIYNKKLSVVPLTTHLEIKKVPSKIKLNLIKSKVFILNAAYAKIFGKKPRIAILGLNPHNSEDRSDSIESKIIKPAVIALRKLGVNIKGPFPADTAFSKQKRLCVDVIIGMYHDQVLAPFKALFEYDAINVTLGLKYVRISPDHGIAQDIIGSNKASPRSLTNAIIFLSKLNA